MHIVKIALNGIGETQMLRYKTADAAQTVYGKVYDFWTTKEPPAAGLSLEDNYGLKLKIPPYSVAFLALMDCEKMFEGDAIMRVGAEQAIMRLVQKPASAIIAPA